MKPVLRNVLVALGLLPMSVFSDTSEAKYEGQANLTGMYGSQNSSYAEADFWQPLWQEWDRVVFGDIRGVKGEGSQWEGNAGGGYRWLAFDEQFLFGAYSFYDYKNSALNNPFQQLTFGGEVKTINWTGRANYYLPIGPTAVRTYAYDTWQWSSPNANGYQNLLISDGYEYSLGGFDAEIGRLIPGVPGLTAYAGMFYFNDNDINEALIGPRLRAEYDLPKVWVKNLQIEGAWQYDEVRGNLWSIGLQISIPFSNKPSSASSNDLTSRMTEYVRRDVNVVSIAKTGLTDYKPYTQNGTVWEFAVINSGAELDQVIVNTTQPNAYVINNDITTSTPNLQLPDNILLMSWKFEYENGLFFALTNKMSSITAPANSDLFILGKNNTISDLNLVVTQGNNAAANNYAGAGNSVGTFVMDNVTTTGAVTIVINDNSTDSNITLTNNTFNNAWTTVDSTGTINLFVNSDNAAMTVSSISGNTLNIDTPPENIYGIYLYNNSTYVIGNITNNKINVGDNASNSSGIFISNAGSNQSTVGDISNNIITFGNGASNLSAGIYIVNNGTLQDVQGDISYNNINFGDQAGLNTAEVAYDAAGIIVNNENNQQTINAIQYNTITFGDNAGDVSIANLPVVGLYLVTDLNNSYIGGVQTINTITHNTITLGNNAGSSIGNAPAGISFFNNVTSQQIIGHVDYNTIQFGNGTTGSSSTAAGINIIGNNSTLQTVNSVSHNTITFGNNTATVGGDYATAIVIAGGYQTVNNVSYNQISFGEGSGSNTISALSFNAPGGNLTIINGVTGNSLLSGSVIPYAGIYLSNSATANELTINITSNSTTLGTEDDLQNANGGLVPTPSANVVINQ